MTTQENVGWVRPKAVTHQEDNTTLRPLGEVVKPTRPRVRPSDKPNLPFIGMEHIEAHTMRLLGTVPASTMKSSAVHFQPGDVMYGRLRPYLNKVYRPDFEGLCSAEFIVFPKSEDIDSRYLQYFLNSSAFVSYASHLNAGDRPRVDFEQLAPYPFPAFPLDQQKRIVAEIEKQFSRLDEAAANLKRYKAAVLKAAVEGRLVETEAAQAGRTGLGFEIAEELLSKLGSEPQSTKRAGRLWGSGHVPELTEGERSNLPEGWVWAKVRDLGYSPEDSVQVGPMSMKSSDFTETGVPVLNVGCVQWGQFDESKLDHLPEELATHFERYRIQPGDALFTRSGTVGRCAVAKDHQRNWLMTFHLLRARPNQAKCLPEYLRAVFEGAAHIRRQTREASIGSTRAGFNTNLLAMLDVPLPPIAEQHRIVSEIDRRLSLVREVESQVDANLKRAQRLRQATLASAFGGRLVNMSEYGNDQDVAHTTRKAMP